MALRPLAGSDRHSRHSLRALHLLLRRVGEHPGLDEPGVHPLVEPVDHLIGGDPVISGDPDDDGEVRMAQVVLGVDQADP